MKLTLRQLDIFLAVARQENVSKAAEELNLSQSAASAALQSLERAYSVKLFERTGNRLTLSSIGSNLRNEAEALCAHARQFEQALQQHGELGHLRVGTSFTIGNYLVARYLAAYLSDYPEANVDISNSNTPAIIEQVLNYEVDVGMVEREVQHRDIELLPWREDELTVFCAADHPLAGKSSLGNRDIKNAQWILREPNSGTRQSFDHAMAELLSDIKVYREFDQNEAIRSAVESGLGIGCLSKEVVKNDLRNGNLVALKLTRRPIRRRFYFALPRKRHHKAAVDAWIEICRNLSLSEG